MRAILLCRVNNLFYYTSYINYHKWINFIGQWVKIRTRDHTGQKSYGDIINILPLIEGVMVDYHTQKTNIIQDEVEGDIVVF
jgi:hypothetical protein